MAQQPTYYDYASLATFLAKRDPEVIPRATTLERFLGKNLKHGDVVNFDDDRALNSFIISIVDDKKRLIKNPDNSGSGYVTIPVEVTRTVPDALSYFSKVIQKLDIYLNDIELSTTDATIRKLFKSPSPILDHGEFSYLPSTNELSVMYNNHHKLYELPITTSGSIDFSVDNQGMIERLFTVTPKVEKKTPEKKPKKKFTNAFKTIFKRKRQNK